MQHYNSFQFKNYMEMLEMYGRIRGGLFNDNSHWVHFYNLFLYGLE